MANSSLNLPSLPLIYFLFLLPFANSVSFNISRFENDTKNILYEGDANASAGTIEFNLVNYPSRVGRATYAEGIRLWDSYTNQVSDFTTHFSFFIDTQNVSNYGHGLAFFIAPVGFQIPQNSAGGFLGLFNASNFNSSHNQIVLVEFDSYLDRWDPPVGHGHMGINKNSIRSYVYTPWNVKLHSGDTADVCISYNATTKNLSVFWTYQATIDPEEATSLSCYIDLMKVLPEWVTIGFTATTGKIRERHVLKSWEFSSSLDIKGRNGKNDEKIRLVMGLAIPASFFIVGAIVGYFIFKGMKQIKDETEETISRSFNDDLEREAGPRRFSYKELALATNNFSNERKLGQGGFGVVYRGDLSDIVMTVAVKKLSRISKQGKKEYITEVKIISRLRHRNLVQLIGWCHGKGEFLLVYEFMPNGSLDTHLFGKKSPLTWPMRHNIAIGLASALVYLHEEWVQCVVHRDIKPSNVMLDSNYDVKLSDFGLARLMDRELGPQTTEVAGTLGYMAPEYMSSGRPSKATDVYSFGIVALEIATGKKSFDPERFEMGLLQWVWDLYGKGNLLSTVDERLHMEFDEKQVECLMIVGLWCAHPVHSLRPSIRQAIQVLNFEAALPNLPMKMPVPMYHVPTSSVCYSKPLITNSLEVGP